jgi:CubicO group peptidase (beta-lactamase class C family)
MKTSSGSKTIQTVIFLLIFVSLAFPDGRINKVDKLFAQWDKSDSPGCALAIIGDGKILYKRGYGMANLEFNIPISPQTVFYIGSVSKQFVALCVAMLEKQGKISFDDDIREYVPELPEYGIPITIRHLIHHTSGLRDYLTLLDIAGIDFGSFHQQDVLDLISRQKELNFVPGEEYLYSNSGYFLLGIIVERASGKTLREFAEKNIFKPLGMKNSRFQDDYRMIIKNRASGYFPTGKEKFKNYLTTYDCVGAGGLYTSVEDLFFWDQNFYHRRVGGKDLIDKMHTRGKLNDGETLDYAYALVISSYKGLNTVQHGGALGGYRSAIIRFPEQNFSVICLANLSSFNPTKLSRQVADIYLADQFKKIKTETKPAEKLKYKKIRPKKLKEKVGTYLNQETGDLRRLFFKNGQLVTKISGQNFPLMAVSESEFHVPDSLGKIVVKFEQKSKETPPVMHIYQERKKPESYEAVQLVKQTPEQLIGYEGEYFSPELRVIFRLVLKDEKLYFVHKNAPDIPLRPILRDKFNVKDWKINFLRNKEDEVSSFLLGTERVKNLMFRKQ